MAALGILDLVNEEPLRQAAFLLSTFYDVPFRDALSIALAESSGLPLLVADDDLLPPLRTIEADRPRFRFTWLPDHEQP